MNKVAIVTDSGANLSPTMCADYPIYQVPFQLAWGGQVYQDGINIQPADFYKRLQSDKEFPTTSQPAPKTFFEIFKSLIDQGYHILGVFTSSKLSSTFDSALQACKALPGALIQFVDSGSTAMELGFHVLAAAQAAVAGATLTECKKIAEKARLHTGIYFVVNTLDYLQRGGRIGGATAFLGNLLSIKPILHVMNGRVEAVGKVRTMRKAIETLLEKVAERIKGNNPATLTALYANEPERAEDLLEFALQHFNTDPAIQIKKAYCHCISPVIGAHTGPDGVGLAYMTGMAP